jgi:alkaline phosphatase D
MNRKKMIQLYGIVIFYLMGSMAISAPQSSEKVSLQQLANTTIERIAFGSCAKQWQQQAIWDAVIAAQPDLFIYLGDAIYADTDGTTAWVVSEKQLQGEWNRLADKPEFQAARAAIPFMATWDNHDYGTHAGGAEFELKRMSKKIFLDFFGEPTESRLRNREGIYDAKIFGPEGRRVQIILLDTKYHRSTFKKDPVPKVERLKRGKVGGYIADDDPAKTHLGKEQWEWLEEQLSRPAEVRLIVSSTQVIANEKGMDEWGNFPRERQRLFDLIQSTGPKGTVILSGNVHFAELSRVDVDGYPLYDFTASGMTHVNELYGRAPNAFRVGAPVIDLNFGMVEIDWSAKPALRLTFLVVDARGAVQFSHSVKLK